MAFLEIAGLSAGYGEGDVLKDINFSLERGEFAAVLGRNGSGKSTLLKALQNFLRNCRGRIMVDGRDIFGLDRRRLARLMAYVPQLFDPVFEFDVQDIVLMGRYVHQGRMGTPAAADKRILEEVMDLAGISRLRGKKLAHLSGGERQRVFIARALAQDTPLLLLDEPSVHLDISFQVEIYQILKRLQREKGKAILAAEHNINLAVPYADRLLFLKDGQLAAQGPPADLITESMIREIFGAEVDIRGNKHSGLPEISLIPYPLETT